MQDLSFDFKRPQFEFNGLRFGVQVFTFENVYGLDADKCAVTDEENALTVSCDGLVWAGGQESAEGNVSVRAVVGERSTTFEIEASCARTIRCVKLFLQGISDGEIINLRETKSQQIPPQGLVLTYPSGWRGLYTPLVVLGTRGGELLYLRSLDPRVREKRFAFIRRDDGNLDIELIFEESATRMGSTVSVPVWEIGACDTLEEALGRQTDAVQRDHALVPWEQREDVPDWARKISLVAAIHCQHMTGYVFNDYTKALRTIEWLAARIEPERLMAYLPGWEGRYYWQYGDYRPDPRMGGEEGFARLIEGARDVGVRVMPMFGINVVNRGMENFEQWGAPAISLTAGGISGGATVDWDSGRHHDHGWGALLNPGAPTWQNRLVGQIAALIDRYGFDGVFLDISAVWMNDPKYDTYQGVMEMVQRIREGRPEVLVGGEGWYDAVGAATPLMQSGHSDGVMHWHDEPYPELFDRYNRSFGHLCLGDPGRGSTGVHELGYNAERRAPVRKGNIPTVTIVDDTLEKAPDKVEEIIEDAKEYAARFLRGYAP
ncbi:MAG: hypothetical protein M3Q29_13100 [Chloroflexota bacterium]|nr:hypothetical protein [Chloroflexota bacterium]